MTQAWWKIRTRMVLWLWKRHRKCLLDRKGFSNNTIHQDSGFLDLFARVYGDERTHMKIREIHNLYSLVRQTARVGGDIAEVGVFRGGSARVICEVKGDRALHLFDTFEGMPDRHDRSEGFWKGSFRETALEDVRSYLAGFDKVFFHKGVFPATAGELDKDSRFSFVNLDVDLYESTRDALQFFYPRMSRGGMILSHDYRFVRTPGVKKAFDEFFAGKPEPVIALWDTQCLVVKW